MKRITSVEYLARMLQPIIAFDTEPARELYRKVLAEALETHNHEVRDAYNAGVGKFLRNEQPSSEQYYNDKFDVSKP